MKLLLVEDDAKIAQFVCRGLGQEGYVVECSPDGTDGLHRASTEAYDALIVDVMLPGLDGLSLIERLRQQGNTVPALILSAKGKVEDRVLGLRKGGDDYLVKPFAFSELVARIQALIRRAQSQAEPTTLRVGELELDLLRRQVHRAGQAIELQPLEYSLLAYLMQNAGRVVSKTMIMEHVWEYNFDPQTNVVEARICRLRDKLDRPFGSAMLRTVRGFGYVLDAAR